MCEPTTMFAISTAASLGSAIMGSSQDATDYNKKIKAIGDEADAINRSTAFKYQLTQLQKQQIQDREAAQIGEARMKLAEASGTGLAAAATGGVEGNSVQALLNGFAVATGKDIMVAEQQADNEIAQVSAEERGIFMDASNRKITLRNQVPDDPTAKIAGRFLTAAMGIGQSYASLSTPVTDKDGKTTRKLGGWL